MPKKRAVPPACNSKWMVNRVASDMNCTLGEAQQLIAAVAQVCASALTRDEPVTMDGIGYFKPVHIKGKLQPIGTGLYPPDGIRLPVAEMKWLPPRRKIHFRPRKSLMKLICEDYRGLDSLEELYEVRKSRANPRGR